MPSFLQSRILKDTQQYWWYTLLDKLTSTFTYHGAYRLHYKLQSSIQFSSVNWEITHGQYCGEYCQWNWKFVKQSLCDSILILTDKVQNLKYDTLTSPCKTMSELIILHSLFSSFFFLHLFKVLSELIICLLSFLLNSNIVYIHICIYSLTPQPSIFHGNTSHVNLFLLFRSRDLPSICELYNIN